MKPNPSRLRGGATPSHRSRSSRSSVTHQGAEERLGELLDQRPPLPFDDIRAILHEEGFDLSRSAIGRWSLEHRAAQRQLKQTLEQAKALTEGGGHKTILKLEEANASLLQSQLLDHLQGKRGVDAETLQIAYAISALTSSASQRERVRLAREKGIRAAIERIKGEIKRELEKHPELVAQFHRIADGVEAALTESETPRG